MTTVSASAFSVGGVGVFVEGMEEVLVGMRTARSGVRVVRLRVLSERVVHCSNCAGPIFNGTRNQVESGRGIP